MNYIEDGASSVETNIWYGPKNEKKINVKCINILWLGWRIGNVKGPKYSVYSNMFVFSRQLSV